MHRALTGPGSPVRGRQRLGPGRSDGERGGLGRRAPRRDRRSPPRADAHRRAARPARCDRDRPESAALATRMRSPRSRARRIASIIASAARSGGRRDREHGDSESPDSSGGRRRRGSRRSRAGRRAAAPPTTRRPMAGNAGVRIACVQRRPRAPRDLFGEMSAQRRIDLQQNRPAAPCAGELAPRAPHAARRIARPASGVEVDRDDVGAIGEGRASRRRGREGPSPDRPSTASLNAGIGGAGQVVGDDQADGRGGSIRRDCKSE